MPAAFCADDLPNVFIMSQQLSALRHVAVNVFAAGAFWG
jgi:hypothetical protein